jgi:hypothetical protein
MLAFVFLVTKWHGSLQQETDETVAAQFFPLNALPPNRPAFYDETLEDLKKFNGKVTLK